MAEAMLKQASHASLTPSKITDFFSNREPWQPSATACVTEPKKPRKGRGRAKAASAKSIKVAPPGAHPAVTNVRSSQTHAKSAKTAAAATQPAGSESNQTLLNGDVEAHSESHLSVKPKDEPVAKQGATAATQAKGETSAKSKTDASVGKNKKKEKDAKEAEPQKPITDYFPVRRSDRRLTSKQLKKEQEKEIQEKILSGCEDGLLVKEIEGKGRGVIATQEFEKDEFVVEYAGELVNITTAKQRESLYAKDEEVGCYMYYFIHTNKQYCIDATAESGKLGRLLNHSRKGNCHTKVVAIGDHPYLVLLASRHIDKGEELTYDYGDRSQTALESHPWLKH